MIIRRAKTKDASQIYNIARSLYINRVNFELRHGFIVYCLSKEEYELRITDNPFYVLEVEGNVVGYLMAYDNKVLRSYLEEGLISHEDKILAAIFNYCEMHNIYDFIFLDQIAVCPEFQRKQYAGLLFRRFCQDTTGPYFGAILDKPIINPNVTFFTKRGMKKLFDVDIEASGRWSMMNGEGNPIKLTWGIYMAEQFMLKEETKVDALLNRRYLW